ncbi:MAG: hypothetical protein V4488_17420 [Pseudomonadota bacterium]
MVLAIASDAITGSLASSGVAGAALEAQLERYQKELADCVNCSSAKTSGGKAQIAELSGKISDLKTRMEKVLEAKPGHSLEPSADSGATAANAGAAIPSDLNAATGHARAGAASLTVGGLLDLYA